MALTVLHTVEKAHEFIIVEFANSASKSGTPIYVRCDRFYVQSDTPIAASSHDSLASTNISIKKTDQAYVIPAYKSSGLSNAEDILSNEAMRYV